MRNGLRNNDQGPQACVPGAFMGSVANLLFREFCRLQVIELPMPGFRILPQKLKFATEQLGGLGIFRLRFR